MGWLISYDKLGYRETVDSRMRKEMSWSQSDAASGWKHEIIASATVGSVWYAAVKVTKPDVAPYVWAMVCLTSRGRGGDGFGYKDMDETMGPVEANCPARILNLLTPTEHEYANQWRQRCRENLAARSARSKARKTLVPGMRIKLAAPLIYSGVPLDTFTIAPTPRRRRGLVGYADGSGMLCRIPARAIGTATIIQGS